MMKTNNTPRAVAALCIAFALSPIAMSAQTFPGTTPVTTTTSDTTYNRGEREEHHDYGWIGLLGLAGLAGLMRKKDDDRRYDTTAGRTDVRR